MTVTLCRSCSPDVGVHSIGASEDPSVGCGLPYYIWSLLSGSLLATASGVFRVPPRSGVAFTTTSGLSGSLPATASGPQTQLS